MAFVAIPSITRGGSGSRINPKASQLAIVKGGRNKLATECNLQIIIAKEAMQSMRWIIGDKVDIFFDDQDPTLVLIKRVHVGGRTLSSSRGKAAYGSSKDRGIIKFVLPKNLPFKHGDSLECVTPEEAHGGLVFKFV